MLHLLQKKFTKSILFSAILIFPYLSQKAFAQTAISPTTWGGTNSTTVAGPSNFTPLPASTTPGSAVVNVSEWNRGGGISYNTGAGRYNCTGWYVAGISTAAAAYTAGKYLTFTVTNDANTELQITGVNIGTGQASGTGPNTFGLLYQITGSPSGLVTFSASVAGPSPTFTGTAFTLCAGQTVTFYMCGWGGSGSAGTYSINTNAAITASYVAAITASASSNSPVTASNPLSFLSSGSNGISPYTYTWSGPSSFSSGISSPTISSPLVTATGTYSVVVTDNWGCTVQATTPVTVNPATPCSGTPVAGTATPTTASFCGSGSTSLNLVGGSAASGLTYQWSSSNTSISPGTNISGATNSLYTTSTISATTYYWCTTTCTVSALSNISAVGTVTVNPTPVIIVTPPGGSYCSGTTGLNMIASGASTYTWSPSSGLSATTGASVTANSTSSITYTVTGTSSAGCPATSTATVNYYTTPITPVITPATTTACIGTATNLLTAAVGTPGPSYTSSGTINLTLSGAGLVTETSTMPISSIPSGATVTSVSVTLNSSFSGNYQNAYIYNLAAPNGKIINLIKGDGCGTCTGAYTNTVVSYDGTSAVSTGATPFTGVFSPDASAAALPTGPYVQNTPLISDLWGGSGTTGTWTLAVYHNYTGTDPNGTLISWSIAINYTLPPVAWSPTTNLFTDAAGTISYTSGSPTATVYENPLTAGVITYTATATHGGCASAGTTTVTVNPLPTPITGITTVCSGLTTTLSDGITGGAWSSSSTSVATIDATGLVTGGIAGTATITYSNGCAPSMTTTVTVISAPGSISSASSVCSGSGTTLSDGVTGGVWSSNSSSVASVGSTSGLVTGGTAGAATIMYSTGCGTNATATITTIAAPVPVGGVLSMCSGLGTLLSDGSAGGIWSSNNTSVATIGSTSGTVTGGVPGIATITYSTGCGTNATATITVISAPGSISGASSVCSGSGTTLSDGVTGGVWSSNNSSVASVGSTSGLVTGGIAGNATITYSTGCGTDATATITTIAGPGPIGGVMSMCSGLGTTLSDGSIGGIWSSNNTSVATVGSVSGTVTGSVPGIATITYSTGCGTDATTTVTVISAPGTISGASSVCSGSGTTLSDGITGGVWSSNNSAVASVGSTSGLVTGGIAGNSTITYSTGCGTNITATITTIAAPGLISGVLSMCTGLGTTLSDGVTGGIWSSNNSSVATVGSISGAVSGGIGGNATITYSTGCGTGAITTVTVIPNPGPITGTSSLCFGFITVLSDGVTGGVWSSNNSSVATVGSTTGLVTGGIAGTVVISYTTGCGIAAMHTVTIVPAPALITGASSVCSGSGITLSDIVTGGTWSSNNSSVATVGNVSGTVTGGVAGVVTITYSNGCGTAATTSVMVIAPPVAISGASSVCSGLITGFTDGIPGGTWSSNNSSVATVDVSGIISGGNTGIATISYTTGCGTPANKVITTIVPPASISGTTFVCPGLSTTLGNSITGGVWSSSNSLIATVGSTSGFVTGGISGTATITYSTGCGTDAVTTYTVSPLPVVAVVPTGIATICNGSTTALTDATSGGAWSSTNTSVATINGTGNVTSLSAGTTIINYTMTNSCGSVSTPITLTVEAPLPVPASITGTIVVCAGLTTALSDATAGGVWTSSNTSVAIVNVSGIVLGAVVGTAGINYTTTNSCGSTVATTTVTIGPLPNPGTIIGSTVPFCAGTTIALSDASLGGTWSSNYTTIATVNNTGIVTGVSMGNTTIFYAVTNSCGTIAATLIVTVEPVPVVGLLIVPGVTTMCTGATTTMSDATIGGMWTSSAPGVATVNNTGIVTGVSGGTATISYSFTDGCGVAVSSVPVTINAIPSPGTITGVDYVCPGHTLQLSDPSPGGSWSTDFPSTAFVTSAGIVYGVVSGSDTVRYTVGNGCGSAAAKVSITVLSSSSYLCSGATSVNAVTGASATELKVFPNPNGGTFTMNLISDYNENAHVIITNVVGEKVNELITTTNKETSVSLNRAAGIYFVSVMTAHGTNVVKIVVTN